MMRTAGRVLLAIWLTTLMGAGACLAAPVKLRVLNWDLKREDGPLAESRYRELAAALMYLEPDIAVLHHARGAASAGRNSAVSSLARSLQMYHAFQPASPGGQIGSALLSRHPIRSSGALSASNPGPPAPGLRAELWVGGKELRVLGVRPRSAEEAKAAMAAIPAAVKAHPGARWIVGASFDLDQGATAAVEAWEQAGLQDSYTPPKGSLGSTYPLASGPELRLDFLLISANLGPGLEGSRVVEDHGVLRLAHHLPVEVRLRY